MGASLTSACIKGIAEHAISAGLEPPRLSEEDRVMSVESGNGCEALLASVSRRLEDWEGRITPTARESLVLAIVQDVASFVLEWSEEAGTLAMHKAAPFTS